MALYQKKRTTVPPPAILIVLCLVSIILLTVWAREGAAGPLHTVRSATGVVITPLQQVGSFVSVPFTTFGTLVQNAATGEDEVALLRQQNDELRATVMQLEEYRQQNERLSDLLELSDAYRVQTTGARVISTGTDSWNRILTIDKGSGSGIAPGMPVMSANGLLGQIEGVSAFSSTVRLLTDEKSGVSVFIQSNRTEGIVTGSIEGLLYMQYVPLDAEVVVGDVVITSGAGGIYPKGIAIGEVASVTSRPTDTYQTIIVRPVTRVRAYEEVLVLTGNEEEVGVTAQDEATVEEEGTDTGEVAPDSQPTTSTDAGSEGR
jgi:rod shape-determining protein MreC